MRHVNSAYFGWQIQLPKNHPKSSELETALKSITGGITRPSEGQIFIEPQGRPSLVEIASMVGTYPSVGLGQASITDVRLVNVSERLYKQAVQAGLPLQEVKT